jgi:hypothetical protein
VDLPQRLARRQEIQSAEYYGARVVPMSGSGDRKGDAETATEMFEFKHTSQLGFRLRLADWKAHVRNAVTAGKRPVWEIEYTTADGRSREYVVVVDRDDYVALRDEHARMTAKIEAGC